MPEVAVYAPAIPVWADLATSDLEAAKTFYRKLFGWESQTAPDPAAGGYTMAVLDGKEVAGLGPQMSKDQPPSWSVYFGSDDADATARKVHEAGGKVIAPPFDVLKSGRMAVFQDPAGAFFSVWQPAEHKGFETTQAPNSFAWAELNTRGIESVKPFYQKVFGWGIKSSPMGEGQPAYTEWLVNDQSIAGGMEMSTEMPASIPPHWLTYFAVAEPDATAKKAAELGGRVNFPPTDFPGGRFAVLSDPQGAVFGILTMKQ